MDVLIEIRDGVLVARAEGRIDAYNSPEFESALRSAIEECEGPAVIDCSDLSYISSAGMRTILMIAQILEEREVKLAVCCLIEEIAELFRISGFDKIIDTYPTVQQALAAVTD